MSPLAATLIMGALWIFNLSARGETGLYEEDVPGEEGPGDEVGENGPPTEDEFGSTFVQWESVGPTSATLAIRNLWQESQIRVDAELNFFGERCNWRAGEESLAAMESTIITVVVPSDCALDKERQKIFAATVRVHVSTLNEDAMIDRTSAPRILAWLDNANDFQLAAENDEHHVVDPLLLERLRSEGLVVEGRSFGF